MDTVEITELEKIDATRVDGVGVPANGIPILLLKSVGVAKGARDCPKCDKTYDADHKGSTCENCGTTLPDAPAAKSLPDWHAEAVALVKKAMVRGKVDETADIDGGQQAIALVGKLIGYEAQELAAGNLGEAADIELLSAAAQLLRQWVSGESAVQDGNVMPATALMQSAGDEELTAKTLAEFRDRFEWVLKGGRDYSAAERKEMAADGRALPDGSYPINDEHDLNSAAILARSGHGDVDAAKRHIAKRAKELGVANPLDSGGDASKSEIAKDGTTVDTVTQETGGLSKAVEEAIAKATAPLAQEIADLKAAKDLALAELAKVKATPVPGGPMMSVVRPAKAADGEDPAKKAAYYEDWAERLSSPEDADRYRQLAAQERAKITS